MSSDLVKRLRVNMHAYGICQDAAARIEALEGEVARLRAVLEEIASGRHSGVILPSYPPQDPAVVRAREALGEE